MAENARQFGERNYSSLYNVLQAYKRSGARNDTLTGDFNRFDTPATFYFRIFFDFSKGLLNAREELGSSKPNFNDIWKKDRKPMAGSALNYLVLNNEWERADMLRDFINLLSNINTNSPWYFSEISGLGDLMDRTEFGEVFTIPEVKPITIKCLPDAYDNRIGTLLDLYRSICYSWHLHKEIVPANLRRFDMYIYIFNTPIRGIHAIHGTGNGDETKEPVNDKWATFDHNAAQIDINTGKPNKPNHYLTSSKLIHLMDCEIDMNANKSGYGELKNDEGFNQVYEIPIKVNTYIEQRYNEILMKFLGDVVVGDLDIMGSNQDSPGELKTVYYSPQAASVVRTVKYEDPRLKQENLEQGIVTPYKGEPLTVEEAGPNRKGSNDQLKKKIYNKPGESLLDPWMSKGKKKLNDIGKQINNIIKSGQSVINSWTDIYRLNRALASSAGAVADRITWGNLFEINLQEITRNLASDVAGFTSDNIFDTVASGWMYDNINRQDNPENSVGGSLFDNPDNPSVPPHEFNPDSIQH